MDKTVIEEDKNNISVVHSRPLSFVYKTVP